MTVPNARVDLLHARSVNVVMTSRLDFDAIALPVSDDGFGPAGHLISKHLHGDPGIAVHFHYWVSRGPASGAIAPSTAVKAAA